MAASMKALPDMMLVADWSGGNMLSLNAEGTMTAPWKWGLLRRLEAMASFADAIGVDRSPMLVSDVTTFFEGWNEPARALTWGLSADTADSVFLRLEEAIEAFSEDIVAEATERMARPGRSRNLSTGAKPEGSRTRAAADRSSTASRPGMPKKSRRAAGRRRADRLIRTADMRLVQPFDPQPMARPRASEQAGIESSLLSALHLQRDSDLGGLRTAPERSRSSMIRTYDIRRMAAALAGEVRRIRKALVAARPGNPEIWLPEVADRILLQAPMLESAEAAATIETMAPRYGRTPLSRGLAPHATAVRAGAVGKPLVGIPQVREAPVGSPQIPEGPAIGFRGAGAAAARGPGTVAVRSEMLAGSATPWPTTSSDAATGSVFRTRPMVRPATGAGFDASFLAGPAALPRRTWAHDMPSPGVLTLSPGSLATRSARLATSLDWAPYSSMEAAASVMGSAVMPGPVAAAMRMTSPEAFQPSMRSRDPLTQGMSSENVESMLPSLAVALDSPDRTFLQVGELPDPSFESDAAAEASPSTVRTRRAAGLFDQAQRGFNEAVRSARTSDRAPGVAPTSDANRTATGMSRPHGVARPQGRLSTDPSVTPVTARARAVASVGGGSTLLGAVLAPMGRSLAASLEATPRTAPKPFVRWAVAGEPGTPTVLSHPAGLVHTMTGRLRNDAVRNYDFFTETTLLALAEGSLVPTEDAVEPMAAMRSPGPSKASRGKAAQKSSAAGKTVSTPFKPAAAPASAREMRRDVVQRVFAERADRAETVVSAEPTTGTAGTGTAAKTTARTSRAGVRGTASRHDGQARGKPESVTLIRPPSSGAAETATGILARRIAVRSPRAGGSVTSSFNFRPGREVTGGKEIPARAVTSGRLPMRSDVDMDFVLPTAGETTLVATDATPRTAAGSSIDRGKTSFADRLTARERTLVSSVIEQQQRLGLSRDATRMAVESLLGSGAEAREVIRTIDLVTQRESAFYSPESSSTTRTARRGEMPQARGADVGRGGGTRPSRVSIPSLERLMIVQRTLGRALGGIPSDGEISRLLDAGSDAVSYLRAAARRDTAFAEFDTTDWDVADREWITPNGGEKAAVEHTATAPASTPRTTVRPRSIPTSTPGTTESSSSLSPYGTRDLVMPGTGRSPTNTAKRAAASLFSLSSPRASAPSSGSAVPRPLVVPALSAVASSAMQKSADQPVKKERKDDSMSSESHSGDAAIDIDSLAMELADRIMARMKRERERRGFDA